MGNFRPGSANEGRDLHALTPSLAAWTAIWPFLAMVEATLTASSTTLPSRTTREIRPRLSASSAEKLRPVSTISIAVDLPTALVSLCVPPAPGITPRLISGWPKLAVGEARMMSHLWIAHQKNMHPRQ